ncbi:MAG TPA: NAD(P)-dependent oxidoreductase [Thermoanaerobaculia bacterium]
MPTCFLTGATGFLGHHVARALVDEGWNVRALVRGDASRLERLSKLPLVPIQGDLSGRTDLSTSLAGCDAIVHVAGVVKARTLDEYREGNARTTKRLVEWGARVCPSARFVYVSSQAAAGPAREGRPVTELDAPQPVSWYGVSKREGEEAVVRGWKGLWLVIRPGVVYGPGDRGLLVMFRSAAKGLLPVPAGRTRVQIIFAEQAGLAIARAAGSRSVAGRTSFLCDPISTSIRDLCSAIARLRNPPARLLPIPNLILLTAGLLETLREAATHRSRPFNADKAREILAGDWLCDGLPLRQDLNLPAPIPLEDGLAQTWQWYRDRGWIGL